MGQKHTKTKNDSQPIPELVRQSSASTEEDCIVCLEKSRKGIICSSEKHFVCASCFSPYVKSVIEDAGKMSDLKFTMKCPYPGCSSNPWTSHQALYISN